jgi:hypothetical protein
VTHPEPYGSQPPSGRPVGPHDPRLPVLEPDLWAEADYWADRARVLQSAADAATQYLQWVLVDLHASGVTSRERVTRAVAMAVEGIVAVRAELDDDAQAGLF